MLQCSSWEQYDQHAIFVSLFAPDLNNFLEFVSLWKNFWKIFSEIMIEEH